MTLTYQYRIVLAAAQQRDEYEVWHQARRAWSALREASALTEHRITASGRRLPLDLAASPAGSGNALLAFAYSEDRARAAYAYQHADVVIMVVRTEGFLLPVGGGELILGDVVLRHLDGAEKSSGLLLWRFDNVQVVQGLAGDRFIADYWLHGDESAVSQAAWWDDSRGEPGPLATIAVQQAKQINQIRVWEKSRSALEELTSAALAPRMNTDSVASSRNDEAILQKKQDELARLSLAQSVANRRLMPARGMAASVVVLADNLQMVEAELRERGWQPGAAWQALARGQKALHGDLRDKLQWFEAQLAQAALERQAMSDAAAAVYTKTEQTRLRLNFLQTALLAAVAAGVGVLQLLTGLSQPVSKAYGALWTLEGALIVLVLAYLVFDARRHYGRVPHVLLWLALLLPAAALFLRLPGRPLWALPLVALLCGFFTWSLLWGGSRLVERLPPSTANR